MDVVTGAVALTDREAGLRATFVPEAGMICCSLEHRGEELLAQNAGLEAYVERGKTMGIPLLYPWANRLAGWSYEAAGRRVAVDHDPNLIATDGNGLPIHGVIGGRMPWKVEQVAERSLTATLAWDRGLAGPFEAFPFEHMAHYEAKLVGGQAERAGRQAELAGRQAERAEGVLCVTVAVEAGAGGGVPVAFGFHPYLSLPGAEREDYEVQLPAGRRLALDERQIPTGGGERVEAWQGRLDGLAWDDGYDSLEAQAAFAVRAGGRRLGMTFTAGYGCGQVYSPRGGRFVCFEPMTAPANGLVSGAGLRVLAPGERYAATWKLKIEDVRAARWTLAGSAPP